MTATAWSITQNGLDEPFWLQVSRGQILGHTAVFASGYVNTLTSATPVLIWPLGTAYTFPASALAMTIVSSAADAGVSVRIDGLTTGYVTVSQTVTLNGTTPVSIPIALLRINNIRVVSGAVTGNLTVASGGTTYGYVAAGDNRSFMAIYTVPAGYTFYLIGRRISTYTANANKLVTVDARSQANGVSYLEGRTLSSEQYAWFTYEPPRAFVEKTDVYYNASTNDTAAEATVAITGVLIANDGSLS